MNWILFLWTVTISFSGPIAYASTLQLLQTASATQNTGEKPQSKVWEHANQFWSVFPNSNGTWIHRLDGLRWSPILKLSSSKKTKADIKATGNQAYVLLYESSEQSFLASVEYVSTSNAYQFSSSQPLLQSLRLGTSVETCTLEIDSAGEMWVAYDTSTEIQVRHSSFPYSSWSLPIVIARGVSSDDISTIISLPGNEIGVFWSNQNSKHFGFRTHADNTSFDLWSTDEVPASQSFINYGKGMADDHMNLKVGTDGTLYAAVKTSYDNSRYPKIALLVRRPNRSWDTLYAVDTAGTRPIVVLDENAKNLKVIYTISEDGGNIIYKEADFNQISFSQRKVLIYGKLNNASSMKENSTGKTVVIAGGSKKVQSVLISE